MNLIREILFAAAIINVRVPTHPHGPSGRNVYQNKAKMRVRKVQREHVINIINRGQDRQQRHFQSMYILLFIAAH